MNHSEFIDQLKDFLSRRHITFFNINSLYKKLEALEKADPVCFSDVKIVEDFFRDSCESIDKIWYEVFEEFIYTVPFIPSDNGESYPPKEILISDLDCLPKGYHKCSKSFLDILKKEKEHNCFSYEWYVDIAAMFGSLDPFELCGNTYYRFLNKECLKVLDKDFVEPSLVPVYECEDDEKQVVKESGLYKIIVRGSFHLACVVDTDFNVIIPFCDFSDDNDLIIGREHIVYRNNIYDFSGKVLFPKSKEFEESTILAYSLEGIYVIDCCGEKFIINKEMDLLSLSSKLSYCGSDYFFSIIDGKFIKFHGFFTFAAAETIFDEKGNQILNNSCGCIEYDKVHEWFYTIDKAFSDEEDDNGNRFISQTETGVSVYSTSGKHLFSIHDHKFTYRVNHETTELSIVPEYDLTQYDSDLPFAKISASYLTDKWKSFYGLIDRKSFGVVFPTICDSIRLIKIGGNYIISVGGKYGLVSKDAQILVQPYYDAILTTESDILIFAIGCDIKTVNKKRVISNGKRMIADMDGNLISHARYDSVIVKPKFIAVKNDELWYILDHKGKRLTNAEFDSLLVLNDILYVKKGGKVGILGSDFNESIPIRYDCIGKPYYSYFKNGNIFVLSCNGKKGLSDANGKILIPAIFDIVIPATGNMIIVGIGGTRECSDNKKVRYSGGMWGFYDIDSNNIAGQMISCDYLCRLEKGMAIFCRDGKFGFVDRSIHEVILPRFDHAKNFNSDNQARVIENGRRILVDKSGNEVGSWRSDMYTTYDDGYSYSSKDLEEMYNGAYENDDEAKFNNL